MPSPHFRASHQCERREPSSVIATVIDVVVRSTVFPFSLVHFFAKRDFMRSTMPKSAVLRKNFAPVKWNEEHRQQQQRWDVEKRATAAAENRELRRRKKKEKRDRGAAQKFITNNVKYKNIWKTRSRIFLFFVCLRWSHFWANSGARPRQRRRWCWESWGCARISREKGEKPKRERTRRALNNVCFKNHAVLLGSRDRPSQQRKLFGPISTSSDVVMSGAGGGREGRT